MKKVLTTVLTTMTLTLATLAHADSVQEISKMKGSMMEKTGVVSVSGVTSLDELNMALAMKASEAGATYYSVTSVRGNNKLSGSATLYR